MVDRYDAADGCHVPHRTIVALRCALDNAELSPISSSALSRNPDTGSGHRLDDPASRFRAEQYTRAGTEFSLLAVSRYGFRPCDIAAVVCKGRNSVTRWLNRGLCDERDDPVFSELINRLDAEISSK